MSVETVSFTTVKPEPWPREPAETMNLERRAQNREARIVTVGTVKAVGRWGNIRRREEGADVNVQAGEHDNARQATPSKAARAPGQSPQEGGPTYKPWRHN